MLQVQIGVLNCPYPFHNKNIPIVQVLLWQKKQIRKKTYPRRNRRSVKREKRAIFPVPESLGGGVVLLAGVGLLYTMGGEPGQSK